MKLRLIAMIFALLFCNLAAAQSYTIRVTHNTNLRASSSMDAAVLTSAPAGATLQVVGRYNRWLRVQRDGNEYWMAGWVRHERVEAAQVQAPAQPASNIDNCCFVDRQCNTDQDWNDGYWAFQNGQCAAPAQTRPQTQPQASTQPVAASPPVGVDNCCFVDRHCQSDQDWDDGYWAFQNGLCAAPGQVQGNVDQNVDQIEYMRNALRIEGSERFLNEVNSALDLLKARAPHWYAYTVAGYDWILEVPDLVWISHPPDVSVWLFPPDFGYYGNTIGFAGVLVHEACHLYQRQAYLQLGAPPELLAMVEGLEAERECFAKEIEAVEDIAPNYYGLPSMRNTLANIDKEEYQWWQGVFEGCDSEETGWECD
ncbi:MAG: SH3 domain-containing protein [Chloroflexota bacterium]|nr:SH3 domain-containing protein [Chloroflexota bacterium]